MQKVGLDLSACYTITSKIAGDLMRIEVRSFAMIGLKVVSWKL